MTRKIVWSPLAKQDYDNILSYLYQNWGFDTVVKFMDNTEGYLQQIINNPKQFHMNRKKEKIRKCVISKQNSLYYTEENNLIYILRIFDNRQNPKEIKF